MATACLGGLPAFTSAATLALNALGEVDFLSGILLSVDDGEVDDDRLRQRTAAHITQRNDRRPSRHAGHIRRVRARCAAAADVQDDHVIGADQVIDQIERRRRVGRQRRIVHGNAASRLVERHARGLVGCLGHSALRASGVSKLFAGKASGKFGVGISNAGGLCIRHDYDPIHELVTLAAEL